MSSAKEITTANLLAGMTKSPAMTVTRTREAMAEVDTSTGPELPVGVSFGHLSPFYAQNCHMLHEEVVNLMHCTTFVSCDADDTQDEEWQVNKCDTLGVQLAFSGKHDIHLCPLPTTCVKICLIKLHVVCVSAINFLLFARLT